VIRNGLASSAALLMISFVFIGSRWLIASDIQLRARGLRNRKPGRTLSQHASCSTEYGTLDLSRPVCLRMRCFTTLATPYSPGFQFATVTRERRRLCRFGVRLTSYKQCLELSWSCFVESRKCH